MIKHVDLQLDYVYFDDLDLTTLRNNMEKYKTHFPKKGGDIVRKLIKILETAQKKRPFKNYYV